MLFIHICLFDVRAPIAQPTANDARRCQVVDFLLGAQAGGVKIVAHRVAAQAFVGEDHALLKSFRELLGELLRCQAHAANAAIHVQRQTDQAEVWAPLGDDLVDARPIAAIDYLQGRGVAGFGVASGDASVAQAVIEADDDHSAAS